MREVCALLNALLVKTNFFVEFVTKEIQICS